MKKEVPETIQNHIIQTYFDRSSRSLSNNQNIVFEF
jgi:hypothetical protein